MCKVAFYMKAYNAEKYLRQAIESVLNQTEKDIRLHIRNNGSTDKTGNIIREYANKDNRISFQENRVNNVLDEGQKEELLYIESEYISFLDSDDYLELNYVEEMYKAAKINNADIVVAGTTMFLDGDPTTKGVRIPPNINSTNMKDINVYFIELYGTLRPKWGKLFKTEFYFKYHEEIFSILKKAKTNNGLDTYQVLEYMCRCKSFSSVPMALHNYRVRTSSVYHSNVDVNRVDMGETLFYKACEYLKQTEDLTRENIKFLVQVFWSHVKDLIELIVEQKNITSDEKLEFLEYILKNKLFCKNVNIWQNVDVEMFNYFGDCVERAVDGESVEKRMQLREFYSYRLYQAYKKIGKNEDEQLFLDIVSSLHSQNNVYMWGAWLLFIEYKNAPDWFLGFRKMKQEDIIKMIKEI